MPPTQDTLSEDIGARAVQRLTRPLRAPIDPLGPLKPAQGNVRASSSIAVDELSDETAGKADSDSDLVAERAVPFPHLLRIAAERRHVLAVAATPAAFSQSARDAIGRSETPGDAATTGLFTEISRGVAQQLWPVESRGAPK